MPNAVDTVVCVPDDGWRYHPKHVEQFTEINELCNVASCWIYIPEYRTIITKGLGKPFIFVPPWYSMVILLCIKTKMTA